MPRINVHDEFWFDIRVTALEDRVGKFFARGVCLTMWRHAQRHWNGACNPIPVKDWELAGYPKEVFEVGLAEHVDGGVYVAGSRENFDWYKKKILAGKIGGKASAAKRKASDPTSAQATVNECLSDREPSSSSSSSSSENIYKDPLEKKASEKDPTEELAKKVLSEFNKITGREFRCSEASLRPIRGRLTEPDAPSFEQIQDMIAIKFKQWGDDPEMKKFLRPETIFGASKFDAYIVEGKEARKLIESCSDFLT